MIVRLNEHMSEHRLHEGIQSALKAEHATETALVRMKNGIVSSMDKNNSIVCSACALGPPPPHPLVRLIIQSF